MIELLAPAGDIKSFYAAINSGADAVYLGLNNFNARLKAENFDSENIAQYIKEAHFYGVKVYITVNTILQNEEFNEMISLVKSAVEAKADAFLVQDLGVVKVLKEVFPGIVLHASTQMGIHNLYGAKVAERLGLKRVVLSRETKLDDIKEIKNNTKLEIEYFVQGALCIAFSGNCYMSSIEQSCSGNRGLCKQLCRLPYTASLNGQKITGYLLSAKDLCLGNNIKELIDAGVTSFKIEGRMRRPGYVATAVSVYRSLIDDYLNGKERKLSKEELYKLKTAFSRNDYLYNAYLDEGTPFVVEKNYGNHTGMEVGYVKSVKPFKEDLYKVDIYANKEIHNGDGLKFFDGTVEKASLGVGDCKTIGKNLYSFITTAKIKTGYKVNLILDIESENQCLSKERLLPISIMVKALVGEPLKIEAKFKDKICCLMTDSVLERAKSVPTTEDEIKKQASKVGDTGFEVKGISVITDGVFIAKSVLNALRRDVLDGLKDKIIKSNEPQDVEIGDLEYNENANFENLSSQLINDDTSIVKKNDIYFLSPSVYSSSRIKEMINMYSLSNEKVALKLPIIANNKDIKILETILSETGIKDVLSENIYGLEFLGKGYNVYVGAGHNIANKYASLLCKDLGCIAVSKSIEYKNFSGCVLPEMRIENEIPVMTFAHCPYKTIYGNECSKCSYKPGLTMTRNGTEYKINRVRLSQCYFELKK